MKLEIVKKFSITYLTDRFYVRINGRELDGHDTYEEAMKQLKDVKTAIANAKPDEVVHSEELKDLNVVA